MAIKDDIKKYRKVYRDNKDDMSGFVASRNASQATALSPYLQRWSDFFDDVNSGKILQRQPTTSEVRKSLPNSFSNVNPLADSPLLQKQPFQVPQELKQINPLSNSDLMKSGQGDPAATQRVLDRSSKITQADLNRARRVDTPLEPVFSWIDKALYENPAGQTVSRFGYSAGEMIGGSIGPKPTTGNAIADAAADITGSLAGFVAPIGGMPNTSLMNTPYKLADDLLNTRLGGKAVQGVSNQLSKVMKPESASRVATDLVRGGVAGAGQNVAQSLMRNESDADQLAISAALGAGLGAAGDAALTGLGAGLRAGKKSLDKRKIGKELLKQVEEAPIAPPQATSPRLELPPRGTASEMDKEEIPSFLLNPNRTLNDHLKASVEELQQPMGIISGKGKTPYEQASLNDTMSQIRSRSQKESLLSSPKTKADRFYQSFVDDVHSFNRFDKFAEDVLNRKLLPTESTHTLALNTRGSDMISSQIIKENMVDPMGNVIGSSLKERLSALPLNRYAQFEDYLLNKHAITRFDRGEKVYDDRIQWTPEKGASKVSEYEAQYPEFKAIADQIYDYQNTMVNEWLVKTGVVSKAEADAWLEANPFYVPNKRFFKDIEKGKRIGGGGAKQGFGDQSSPVKKYGKAGSQRQIISPLEAIIENTDAFVKTAKRNEVMQKFTKLVANSPEEFKDWAEIVQSPNNTRKTFNAADDIETYMEDLAIDFANEAKKTSLDRGNIVKVLVNGEPIHIQVKDPDLLESMLAISPDGSVAFLDAIGKVTNMFKTFTTGVNPYFVFRNLTRDLGDAWVNSRTTNNPVTFIGDYLKSAFDIMKNGEAWRQYKNVGGGHTSEISNRNMIGRSKDAVLPQTIGKKVSRVPIRTWRAFEDVLNATESMARLGEFRRAAGNRTPDELQAALYEAQEVAINFKRRGTITKQIDKVFPYFNAAVQGLDRFVRVFKDDPVKASTKAFMALTIPTAVLYAMNRDNPRYQELSENTRDNFFLIPYGDKFIKIAKPRELGTIFSAIPERLMMQFADDNPEAWKDFSEQLINTFTVPMVEGALSAADKGLPQMAIGALRNTIASPFMDVAMNENFAGAPVVPADLSRLSRDLQYDEKTSQLARFLGEKGLGSPKEIDHVLKGYFGGLAKATLPAATPSGNPVTQLFDQFIADPLYNNSLSNDFYEYKDKIDKANTERDLREELPAWYDDSVRKQMNKLSKSMSETRKEMRLIEKDKSLDRKEKEKQVRAKREQLNEFARQGLKISKGSNIK